MVLFKINNLFRFWISILLYFFLNRFITKYVVCSKCTYPELKMIIQKNIVKGICAACGQTSELDNKH